MRLTLTLLMLTFGAFPSRAATGLSSPIFTNFYTPHFIVAPNSAPTQIIKSRIFGTTTNITTNIFNNTVNIFTNSTIIINGTNLAGGDSLWTNRSAIYYPTVTNAQTIVFGRSAESWWLPTVADGFVNVHDASAGDSQFNTIVIAAIDQPLQENWSKLESTFTSGNSAMAAFKLVAATNWQNPSAPYSQLSVNLDPVHGNADVDFMNNGIHDFAVANQITSVQALQFVPITNAPLALSVNPINVRSNSYVALSAANADPTQTFITLSTGLRDGIPLLLQNVGINSGFTLYNGSPLNDDITKWVTLQNGDWATTNYGDSILLVGGWSGWSEVGRFTQNTNVVTGAQLWELVSGHMRTVPNTLDDWQFRYGGVPQLTVGTNGGLGIGANWASIWGSLSSSDGIIAINRADLGDAQSKEIWLASYASPSIYGFVDAKASTNSSYASVGIDQVSSYWTISMGDDTGTMFENALWHGTNVWHFEPTIADSPGSVAYTFDTATALTDPTTRILVLKNAVTNQFSFGPDARINWGVGNTNTLFRSANNLVYTNGGTEVYEIIQNGAGRQAQVGISPGGQAVLQAAGGANAVTLNDSTVHTVTLFNGVFAPSGSDVALGTDANHWTAMHLSGIVATSGKLSVTNGIIQQIKDSFSTNYVIGSNTNQQFFLLNGTNQLVTLPAAAGVKDIIYRFSMTNGLGSFVITNAADGAKIRDGISLSYTNIGVNEVGFISDGSNWWLASKGKQIFPSASWSLGNTISPVQDVITNIPFTQLEFNNSQGIALRTKAGFTGATELAITNAGTYLITFSAVLKGSGGGSVISIWLRKDGVDVPRTRTDQGFTGATAQQCMTVNYFVQVGTTPSYFELCAASHDASPPTIVSAAANPTGYTAPAMPGVIVTINRVSDTWP